MSRFTIGQYTIQGLLGSGGTGQVYSALDQDLGRLVAIKALRPEFSDDRDLLERFRNEAANLARLNHPNITTLYSLHRETTAQRQSLFLVMEMVSGETLEAILARAGRLSTETCLAIARQAIAGLSYAHTVGIVHRDIKPSNIMLNEAGLLKIMDFGIARAQGSERLTRHGALVGTLNYIAPEQIKGYECDERSDLYSLACVLYKLLSGRAPFAGLTEYELIQAQLETEPEPLSALVPDLDHRITDAVMRALAKDPNDRFASLDEFGCALGTLSTGETAAAIVRDQVVVLPPHPLVLSEQLHLAQAEGTLDSLPVEPDSPSPTVAQKSVEQAARPGKMRGPGRAAAVAAGVVLLAGGGIAYALRHSAEIPAGKGVESLSQVASISSVTLPAKTLEAFGGTHARPSLSETVPLQAPPPVSVAAVETPPPPQPVQHGEAPAATNATVVQGPVSSLSEDGWPVIDGTTVRLMGVSVLAPGQAKPVFQWIATHGNYLACNASQSGSYRCLTRQNIDLAQAILLNGAARASTDATPVYRDAEAHARVAKRGVWR